jgi:hypothetical protein
MIFLFKSYTLAVNHQLLEINKCLIFLLPCYKEWRKYILLYYLI